MTPEQRKAARKRCEAATPGPWHTSWDNTNKCHAPAASVWPSGRDWQSPTICHVNTSSFPVNESYGNTGLIAEARTDLPAALDHMDECDNILLHVWKATAGLAMPSEFILVGKYLEDQNLIDADGNQTPRRLTNEEISNALGSTMEAGPNVKFGRMGLSAAKPKQKGGA